jgi:hypothetical protein
MSGGGSQRLKRRGGEQTEEYLCDAGGHAGIRLWMLASSPMCIAVDVFFRGPGSAEPAS